MHLTTWFRKHQRYLLAAAVVMLMISFGILGTVQSLIGRTEETYGSIHGKVVTMADMRATANAVRMARLLVTVDPQALEFLELTGAAPRVMAFHDALLGFVFREDEQVDPAAWRLLVLLREAEEVGLDVTPAEAGELLTLLLALRNRYVGSADPYQDLLRAVRLPESEVAAQMLALARMTKLVGLRREAVLSSTPELWMTYGYLNERARVRFVEVDGAWFSHLVAATDEDLHAFYEAHKDVTPDPESGTIGYMAPERVRLEYAEAPLADLIKEADVSEEAIAAYYRDNKVDFLIETEEQAEAAGADSSSEEAVEDAAAAEDPAEDRSEEGGLTSGFRYQPLDEVRDVIRQTLAGRQARDKGRERVREVLKELRSQEDQFANEPRPLGQMARRHALNYQMVRDADGSALLSRRQVEELLPEGEKVAEFAFGQEWALYYPEAFDTEDGGFLLQVLEQRDPEVQAFEEVKERVRRDCLAQRALEQATTFAEEFRDRADEGGFEAAVGQMNGQLRELLHGQGATASETTADQVLAVRESEFFKRTDSHLPDIEAELPAVVAKAFQIGTDQVAVAVAGPPVSRCYVLQTLERQSAPREEFSQDGEYLAVPFLRQKRRSVLQAWMKGLLRASRPVGEPTG